MLLRAARRECEAVGPAEAGGFVGADAASRVTVAQQNAVPEAASPTPPALAGIVRCPHCGKEVTVASTPTPTMV
jgi:hypothetical protein